MMGGMSDGRGSRASGFKTVEEIRNKDTDEFIAKNNSEVGLYI